jgi:hypothetical protein
MLEITDYGVPELNTSGMEETSVGTLLPIPFADVQVWTRGLEPTNDGTVFPSEVLPPPSTAGRVARVIIPPRLSSLEQEPTNGGTVCPSEVLPPAYTTGRVMRVILPRLPPSAPEYVPTTITAVEDRAALHAPCCSGGGIAAQEGEMPHIVIGSHVNHIVDMACLTEFQKLENLIYLETGAQLIIAIVSTISWIGKTSTLQGEEKAYPLKGNIGPRRGCKHGMHERTFAPSNPSGGVLM